MAGSAAAAAPQPLRLRVLRWTRTLHIYVSLVAFCALLFFGTTGFMMNHGDWFGVEETTEQDLAGTIPAELLAEPDRLGLVELLRSSHGAEGPLLELDVRDDEIRILFAKPGSRTDAFIDRSSGELSGYRETSGTASVLAAIHKGDDTGLAGSFVIDVTAGLLLFVALSGLVLWTSLPRRRRLGAAFLAVSVVALAIVYVVLVVV